MAIHLKPDTTEEHRGLVTCPLGGQIKGCPARRKVAQFIIIDLKEQIDQIRSLKQSLLNSKKQVDSLTAKLFELNAQVSVQESEINRLNEQWKLGTDRLIVVLKMSGRCTVRSIVEVLEYGLGISVSVGYVQNTITQAGENAEGKLKKL